MTRTTTEPQKTITIPLTKLVPKVAGLSNTIFTQNKDTLYAGQYLVNQYPTTTAEIDLTVPVAVTTQRITGSYIFDLDSDKTIMITKVGTTISLYEYNSTTAPTAITTLTTASNNAEVYLEAIFCGSEKAVVTGFNKYVFLSLVGEAWVVAYSTRTSSWTYEKLNTTYSAWASGTNYALGNKRIPTVANGYYYEVSADAGSSGVTEPTWPTTIGDTVVDSGITWVCRGRYGNFPTTTSSSVRTLNGYIFVCVDGDIYNSDLDLPDSWNTSDFISTEIYPDIVVALAKYKNYLVAFGQNTIEFFYDAANVSGSPLQRQEGVLHNIGCIGQAALCELEDRLFWISQSGSTYYSLWELDKFEAKKISLPEFDNQLTNAFIESVTFDINCISWQTMFAARINGRYFLGVPVIIKNNANPARISTVYLLDLETEFISAFPISTSDVSICRPFIWRNFYLWATSAAVFPGPTASISWTVLAVNGYDNTFTSGTQFIQYFAQDSFIYTHRISFDSNNYKVLNEIQTNPFSGVSGGYWYVEKDRTSLTQFSVPSESYKVHRLGRAREFRFLFRGQYEISQVTFKYTEHAN